MTDYSKRAVMFSPISIDEFVKKHVSGNPGESAADLCVSLEDAVKRKQDGRMAGNVRAASRYGPLAVQ